VRPNATEISPSNRKYHSGLSKVESNGGEQDERMENSPSINVKHKASKTSKTNVDLAQSRGSFKKKHSDNASSQGIFDKSGQLGHQSETLVYGDDYSL